MNSFRLPLILFLFCCVVACAPPYPPLPPETATWSRGRDPGVHFDDRQVIALCNAIKDKDLPEVVRLIEAGADCNAVGKMGVTPLVWCLPLDNDIFEYLLRSGANPNVFADPEFAGAAFRKDECVTFIAALQYDAETFGLLLDCGGDPNLRDPYLGSVPMGYATGVNTVDAITKVRLLLAKGADPNSVYRGKPAISNTIDSGLIDISLLLLQAGADPTVYGRENLLPAHYAAERMSREEPDPMKNLRLKMLISELQKRGAWLGDPQTEIRKYRELQKTSSEDASTYTQDLRDALERQHKNPESK